MFFCSGCKFFPGVVKIVVKGVLRRKISDLESIWGSASSVTHVNENSNVRAAGCFPSSDLGQGLIFPVRIKSLRFGPDGAPQGLKFSKTQKSKTR